MDITKKSKKEEKLEEDIKGLLTELSKTQDSLKESVETCRNLMSEHLLLKEEVSNLKDAIVVSFVKSNSKPESGSGVSVSGNEITIR